MPTGMEIDKIPSATARALPDHVSETRIVVVTNTPPTPKPERNRQTDTRIQDGAREVSSVNKPKQSVLNTTVLDLPARSQMTPHTIPPNIQPKINTELMVALIAFNLSADTFPIRSLTATGRYTDINVITTPPNKLLTKQMIKTAALP